MKLSEYCKREGISIDQFQKFSYDYLQCEGYGDDGEEYDTLHEYIISCRKPPKVLHEPIHKGDYNYGL